MTGELHDAVRSAAQTRPVPGGVPWRILMPDDVGEIAARLEVERRAVELAALDAEIVPVHYMRNIARFAIRGQMTLLESGIALMAAGAAARKCLEILSVSGVGELRLFPPPEMGEETAAELAELARNLNASVNVTPSQVDLRRDDPADAFRGLDLVACCVESAADEGLLQAVCRRLEVPLVCVGVQESRAQATVILPGDPGVGLIYKPVHPHIDRERPGATFGGGKAPVVAGAWLAEQSLAVLLGHPEALRGRLLFADLYEGEMETYPL